VWLDAAPEGLPPLRMLLVWDNLSGHKSPALVDWLLAHGVASLYTPLSGSWLNMAESIQRILVARVERAASRKQPSIPQTARRSSTGSRPPYAAGTAPLRPSPGAASGTSAVSVAAALPGQARRFHIPHQLRRDPLVLQRDFDYGG